MNVQVASWSATATALPASVGRLEHDLRPVERRAADAGRHVLDDPHAVEPGLERRPVLGGEAHPDRQQRERRALPEQPVLRDLDLAAGNAPDVVLAVREQDQHRPFGVGREVLRGLLHRRHVVGVDADLLAERRVEALAIGGGHGAQAAGQPGDGLRAVEHVQVGAARVVPRLAGELDEAERRVAGDQVRRGLVDPVRDALERRREPVAGRGVLQDRGREVEDEHDVGLVRARGEGSRSQAADQLDGDGDGDDGASRTTEDHALSSEMARMVGQCRARGRCRQQATRRGYPAGSYSSRTLPAEKVRVPVKRMRRGASSAPNMALPAPSAVGMIRNR